MRVALKEWAVVVEALIRGKQSLLIRKGGLVEGPGGFQVEHPRFLLFPTRFHQQREQVVPAAQSWYDEWQREEPAGMVRIEAWAEVVAWRKLHSLTEVERLRGRHIWRDEVIAGRFQWGRESSVHALILRVHRLARPWTGESLPGYGGCKSWLELAADPSLEGSNPVISDAEFHPLENELLRLLPCA